ncbi:MAG: hypothetical protein EPO32_06275 [Anaerolineae bacterium]|nr:MAG: hypothetical protein EPO32_06275 [Anaerolineae bacterium]
MPTKHIQPQLPRHTVEALDDGVRVILPRRKNIWTILWLGFMSIYSSLFVLAPISMVITLATEMFRTGLAEYGSLSGILQAISVESDNVSKTLSLLIPVFLVLGLFFSFFVLFMLFVLYHFSWQLVGRELIEASPMGLSVTKQIFGWRQIKEYSLDSISDLRISALPERFSNPFYRLLKHDGVIGLDYGAKTYRFGLDIDEAEAKMIIAALKPFLPNLNNS